MSPTPAIAACNKSKEKPGGCALRGAKLALQPITDVIHVVHGSSGCLGHVWSSRPTQSSDSHLHRLSATTALGEIDLVMGGTQRLQTLLDRVAGEFAPTGIFVYQSCLTAMLGDDLVSECQIASKRLNLPVIAIDAPGFAGGKQKGHQIAVKTLLEQVIGNYEPAITTHTDINLIGEFNVMGEVEAFKKIVNELGIRILASIPGDGRFSDIASAHRAKISLDLCSQAMPGLAERLYDTYAIPFIKGSLYGSKPFADTLKSLAAQLVLTGADEQLNTNVERFLSTEKKQFAQQLLTLRPRLNGKRVLIYLGGLKTWSLIEDLQAAGLIICGVSLHKCNERDKSLHADIKQQCLKNKLPDWQEKELTELLRSGQVDILLSGGGMRYTAQKYAVPCVEMSHERQHSLLGFEGIIALLNEIDTMLHMPVLQLISSEITSKPDMTPLAPPCQIIPAEPTGNIQPFALTQPMGALLAMQGIQGGKALLFGAQGCAASGLIFLSRYFGEQINIHSVSLNEIETIHGGQSALNESLRGLSLSDTSLIAVVTTGMMEAQGVCLPALRAEPASASLPVSDIIDVYTPDFEGTLQDGWGKAIHAVAKHITKMPSTVWKAMPSDELIVLPGSHISIGDIEWLKELADDFAVTAHFLPDLSTSLDGEFTGNDNYLLKGGSSLPHFASIQSKTTVLALGEQMRDPFHLLTQSGQNGLLLNQLTGLRAADQLIQFFAQLSGNAIPPKYTRQRAQLLDAMMDNAKILCHGKAVIAAEPDLLFDLTYWLQECGIKINQAISPAIHQQLTQLPLSDVFIGDSQAVIPHLATANVLIAPDSFNSVAHSMNLPHFSMGIHEQIHVGSPHFTRLGYKGARDFIFMLSNLLLGHSS